MNAAPMPHLRLFVKKVGSVRAVAHHVDRPLRLSEILAETIRLYGERIAAALALGGVFTGALFLGVVVHPITWFVLATVAFGATYAAACRLAAGDSFGEAWGQVVLRTPLLIPLFFAVVLPFVVTLYYGILVLLGAAWLALGGFAIPVAMLESPPDRASLFVRMGFAFDRAIQLARVHYLHALGVVAALLVVELLVSQLLIGLLLGFADNTAAVAAFLAGIVLWPFVFLGLAVLYFEQRTRVRPGAPRASEG
jgi:hypothetical protein